MLGGFVAEKDAAAAPADVPTAADKARQESDECLEEEQVVDRFLSSVSASPQALGWYVETAEGSWEPYTAVVNSWLDRAVCLIAQDEQRWKAAIARSPGAAPLLGHGFQMTQGTFVEPKRKEGTLPYFNGFVVISEDRYVSLSDMRQHALGQEGLSDAVRREAGQMAEPIGRLLGEAEPKPLPVQRQSSQLGQAPPRATWQWSGDGKGGNWKPYPEHVSARLEQEVLALKADCLRQDRGQVQEGQVLCDGWVIITESHTVSLKDMKQFVLGEESRWRVVRRVDADGTMLNNLDNPVRVPRTATDDGRSGPDNRKQQEEEEVAGALPGLDLFRQCLVR